MKDERNVCLKIAVITDLAQLEQGYLPNVEHESNYNYCLVWFSFDWLVYFV